MSSSAEDRARAWQRRRYTSVCDLFEPWHFGTVLRATRYPDWWEVNVVRVERPLTIDFDALLEFTDRALARYQHRRIWFERLEDAAPLRSAFEARGWKAERLALMLHNGSVPPGPAARVERVDYDAVHELRIAWHNEDYPGIDATQHHADMRELDLRSGAEVLAVSDSGAPVAFTQIETDGDDAEVAGVYVLPSHRGRGLGTAVTRAAIEAASGARDLWIEADDEYHAKDLYAKLGFEHVYTYMSFIRLPPT
jgi:ribosomal-protein-alanine N-acetyltransferase